MSKKVSVIIVNFNGGDLLTQCVLSVMRSTLEVELFVVDNGSTDGSIEYLKNNAKQKDCLTIIQNTRNVGFAKANNIAIGQTSGEYVLLLNPDTLIYPDTLEKMWAVMESHPKAGIGGALILNPDGTEQKGCRRKVPTPWRTFVRVMGLSRILGDSPWFSDFDLCAQPLPREPVVVDAISGSFMFVRRTALMEVGVMDEDYFLHCEDLDWCMRFSEKGYDVLFVPEIPITHYKGVCGRQRPVRVMWHMHRGMVRFYQKFFRKKYSIALMWLVFAAVWLRFVAIATIALVKGIFSRGTARKRDVGPVDSRAYAPAGGGAKGARNNPKFAGMTVAVSGATSQIGRYMIPALLENGVRVIALTRRKMPKEIIDGLVWVTGEFQRGVEEAGTMGATALIHAAPIWVAANHMDVIADSGIRRVVAFSSTSRYTKIDSGNEKEKALADQLVRSEETCLDAGKRCGIRMTLFRPTMIYGNGLDKNIAAIARLIRRFRVFLTAGAGVGMRQPVHAEDLADACVSALVNERTYGRSYNLSGGETLTYHAMVARIYRVLGAYPLIVKLPLTAVRGLLKILAALPGFRFVTPAMADRMNEDLCFDHAQATSDFDYNPRKFLEVRLRLPGTSPAGMPVRREEDGEDAMKTVMVTGANGFIGTAVCRELTDRGYNTVRVVRGLRGDHDPEPSQRTLVIDELERPHVWGDSLRDVDCIIHLAAVVHETPFEPPDQAWETYKRLNIDATVRLAREAANAGVKKFIYISSVKVHGEKSAKGEKFNEEMTPNPYGPYAESKLYAEDALRKIEKETGLGVVVVRPPLVYGPEVKANFHRLLKSIEQGMPLPLANVENKRSFVYIGNLVDFLIRCIGSAAASGQTFLVSDGEDVSTPQLIRALAYLFGKEPMLFPLPVALLEAAGGVSGGQGSINRLIDSLAIDNSKGRALLEWNPPFTLMEGLAETVEWYKALVYPLKPSMLPTRRVQPMGFRETFVVH